MGGTKTIQAEETECAKLLKQERAQTVWAKRSFSGYSQVQGPMQTTQPFVEDLGCFPEISKKPLKGFRQSGAVTGCAVEKVTLGAVWTLE